MRQRGASGASLNSIEGLDLHQKTSVFVSVHVPAGDGFLLLIRRVGVESR